MQAPAEPEIENRLVKAWGRAVVNAHNRVAPEVTTEDLLAGLFEEYGESLFAYFTTPDPLRALIEHVQTSRILHEEYPYPPGEDSPELAETRGASPGYAGLAPSFEYADLMMAVNEEMESGAIQLFTLAQFIRILAQSQAAKRIATEHHVGMRWAKLASGW